MTPKLRDAMERYILAWNNLWACGVRLKAWPLDSAGQPTRDRAQYQGVVEEHEFLAKRLAPLEAACRDEIVQWARSIVAEECARVAENYDYAHRPEEALLMRGIAAAIREHGRK